MSLQDKLRLTAQALRHKPVPLSTVIPLLQEAADALDDPCIVDPFSSRACQRGTKACKVEHKPEKKQEQLT